MYTYKIGVLLEVCVSVLKGRRLDFPTKSLNTKAFSRMKDTKK